MASTSAREEILEGTVLRTTFENDETGFRVLKVEIEGRPEPLPVIGVFPRATPGSRIRASGNYENDGRHGAQFRARTLTELSPATLVGLERYLGSGVIPGVGVRYASKIVAHFGDKTLQILDESPRRLTEVAGLGKRRAETIAQMWSEQRAMRETMVILQSFGLSFRLAQRVVKRYGNLAATVVSAQPYRLAIEVSGVGFKTADRIAQQSGIALDSPERAQAGLLQVLRDDLDAGHTYLAQGIALERGLALLELGSGDVLLLESAMHALLAAGLIDRAPRDTEVLVALAHAAGAEERLAKHLARIVSQKVTPIASIEPALQSFEKARGFSLAEEQRSAIAMAAKAPAAVITGGPGVGKTTIVRALLALFAQTKLRMALAAPTGRAAKRMTETTGYEATTLHRLLEFEPRSATFVRNAGNPLELDVLVVDESSMVDLLLAEALLGALKSGTRLFFVGDVDQLPSVGPGAVLRDIIDSRVMPCARLGTIFRQASASLIVTNAHRINQGQLPRLAMPGELADFFIIERTDPEHALATVLELVSNRIPNRFGYDCVRDVQVLTPMNRGAAGTIALNAALQTELNPRGRGIERGGRTFRVGDKVMQLRNDYDRGVYNGDVGFVLGIPREDEAGLTVRFDDRDVDLDRRAIEDLSLAYACTVHKSQGSEYPAVVIPFLTSHYMMLSRNLLYTAVTRGKNLVVLVCDPRALSIALAEDRRDERRTRLAERLANACYERQLA